MSNKNSRFKSTPPPNVWRHIESVLNGEDRANYLSFLDALTIQGGQVVNITRRIRKGQIILATGQASEADKHELVVIARVPEAKLRYFLGQAPLPAEQVADKLMNDLDDGPPEGAV
jgi:hypothetical protein